MNNTIDAPKETVISNLAVVGEIAPECSQECDLALALTHIGLAKIEDPTAWQPVDSGHVYFLTADELHVMAHLMVRYARQLGFLEGDLGGFIDITAPLSAKEVGNSDEDKAQPDNSPIDF